MVLPIAKELANFACGNVIVNEGPEKYQQFFAGVVYANPEKSCRDPVEKVLYSSGILGQSVCCQCGTTTTDEDEAARKDAMKKRTIENLYLCAQQNLDNSVATYRSNQ